MVRPPELIDICSIMAGTTGNTNMYLYVALYCQWVTNTTTFQPKQKWIRYVPRPQPPFYATVNDSTALY